MSNFNMNGYCNVCKKSTPQIWLNDFYGEHEYAIKCSECHTIMHEKDFETGAIPVTPNSSGLTKEQQIENRHANLNY